MDRGWLGVPNKISQTCIKSATTLDRVFTNELVYTFIWETECIINQHPVTAICDDVSDFDTFTPNHFLIGEENPQKLRR